MDTPFSIRITPRTKRVLRGALVYGILPALCLLLCLALLFFQLTQGFVARCAGELTLGEELQAFRLWDSTHALFTEEAEPMFAPDALMPTEGIAYIGELPEGVFPVLEVHIGNSAGLINATENSVDADAMYASAYPFAGAARTADEPLVLVLHTHATESYYTENDLLGGYVAGQADNVFGYYAYDSDTRSYDPAQNVVAVGKVFCDKLGERGIPAVHCETQHDAESYSEAYVRSLESINAYLAQYPSIRYVIDLHRDSLLRAGGEKLKPTAVVDGEKVAQVMLVVGCGGKSAAQPHWRDNLALNYKWQSKLRAIDESFARPLYLRYGRFNQQVSAGTMLLEVGSCGNTLAEAKRAGALAADALADMIYAYE